MMPATFTAPSLPAPAQGHPIRLRWDIVLTQQAGARLGTAIRAEGLAKSFGEHRAVDDLTLDVAPGEVLALLGPNGAGKTTTVRLLNGVLAPDAGGATVLGLDPTVDGEELRRRTGVLTETAGLDDRLTARENVLFTARIRGYGRQEAERRTDDVLERFAMTDLAGQRCHGFSTGQRKRVALARALLHDPDLLFLDEPTSGLDPSATREVIGLIARLATEEGRTVVLCTHFLGEAGRLADRMAVLNRGRLVVFGRPDDIAAELWPGLDVDVDLDGAAPPDLVTVVRDLPGVLDARPSDPGLRVVVEGREVVPQLAAALTSRGLGVYGVTPKPPTLEDVYFAIEARMEPIT
jgi:ABC-2 type transport system ATP-binding protein